MSRTYNYSAVDEHFLPNLNEELRVITSRLDEGKKRSETKAVSLTTETKEIRHGLGVKPTKVIPTPRQIAVVCQPQPANATSVFLAASTDVDVDLYLEA
jgi:hypothetical protein